MTLPWRVTSLAPFPAEALNAFAGWMMLAVYTRMTSAAGNADDETDRRTDGRSPRL